MELREQEVTKLSELSSKGSLVTHIETISGSGNVWKLVSTKNNSYVETETANINVLT